MKQDALIHQSTSITIMKAWLLALFLVFAFVALAQGSEDNEKAPVISPVPIKHVFPRMPFASCSLWECNSNCINRGYRGGYCGYPGCRCY